MRIVNCLFRNPADFSILCNRVFDNFTLADELLEKASGDIQNVRYLKQYVFCLTRYFSFKFNRSTIIISSKINDNIIII